VLPHVIEKTRVQWSRFCSNDKYIVKKNQRTVCTSQDFSLTTTIHVLYWPKLEGMHRSLPLKRHELFHEHRGGSLLTILGRSKRVQRSQVVPGFNRGEWRRGTPRSDDLGQRLWQAPTVPTSGWKRTASDYQTFGPGGWIDGDRKDMFQRRLYSRGQTSDLSTNFASPP
jgi:hypothetical protein